MRKKKRRKDQQQHLILIKDRDRKGGIHLLFSEKGGSSFCIRKGKKCSREWKEEKKRRKREVPGHSFLQGEGNVFS